VLAGVESVELTGCRVETVPEGVEETLVATISIVGDAGLSSTVAGGITGPPQSTKAMLNRKIIIRLTFIIIPIEMKLVLLLDIPRYFSYYHLAKLVTTAICLLAHRAPLGKADLYYPHFSLHSYHFHTTESAVHQ
jgi:hypothetical protein